MYVEGHVRALIYFIELVIRGHQEVTGGDHGDGRKLWDDDTSFIIAADSPLFQAARGPSSSAVGFQLRAPSPRGTPLRIGMIRSPSVAPYDNNEQPSQRAAPTSFLVTDVVDRDGDH